MTTKFKRIESLKKEVVKTYEEKGIAEEWFDFKIKLKESPYDYEPTKLYQTVINKFITHFRKLLEQAETVEDVVKLANNVSFGQSKLIVSPMFPEETASKELVRKHRIVELLSSFFKLKVTDSNREGIKAKHWPIQVELKQIQVSRFVEKTGYTFAKDKFPKSVFKNKYSLRKYRDMEHEYVFDLASLLAESFLINSIELFAMKNPEWVRYAVARGFLFNVSKGFFTLPTEETYRKDLIDTLNKYHLYPKNVELEERDTLNLQFRDTYYLTKTEQGFIKTASLPGFYRFVLPEMLYQMEYIKDKTKRRMEQTSDYARAFQTKKHINKSTEEVMKNNSFLDNFGFTELDNDVDLAVFRDLQAEFKAFRKQVYIPIVKDHSFRIKKLGKHKAAGLYYPAPIKAVIFDLSSPDSFLHEVTHLIDFTFKEKEGVMLSESLEFKKIIDLYSEAVTKSVVALDENDPFRTQWEGTSKYNKAYYLQPHEVFARSYEVHLFENRGIRSSFLKTNYDGLIYPKDETYLHAIAEYFDELFDFFEAEEELNNESNENEAIVAPKIIHDEVSEDAKKAIEAFVLPNESKEKQTVKSDYYLGEQLSLF
ncbi:LPD1 domain-containing protein [Peribacillus asahii]|uniref:LPD1 domain-containing protein n=1 Tax=Peribacillus asahii TaxID=228899 RepID=UPI0020797EAE|nr:LPD1 domain-containing protein [Peribacillus asahii]USK62292.1 hypothetical protein LIT37_24270 [Peribacillus asahii]